MNLHDAVRGFYFNEDSSVFRVALRWLLAPLVPVYATVRRLHQFYRCQIGTGTETPVLSVGNISVGGTGKTAFTLRLIEKLTSRDYDVGLLKRGEGTSEGIVPSGSSIDSVAREYGDETALYRQRYPNMLIGVGRDRVELAAQFDRTHDLDLLILEDGFQYRQLERTLDVVLIAPGDVRNNWQLPAGPLREPLASLGRADVVSMKLNPKSIDSDVDEILTGETDFEGLRLKHYYDFEGIYREGNDVTDEFRDSSGVLLTTLARPGEFEAFLAAHQIRVARHVSRPDHAGLTGEEVRSLADPGDVLVTEKEAVKLPDTLRRKVGVVKSRLKISPMENFLSLIDEQLPERGSQSP